MKAKKYNVIGKLSLDVSIPVYADSLEDCIKKSKDLRELDFVKILGEFDDGSLKIVGAYEIE